ncbi:MAG TPA: histidinol dehydrogenase [Lacibacter sp.]|nr:histidinol dehydrogenase [Lacibacter sp.]HMO89646.1 histidinol dehydrogenase [Lacibacter sp.]HMP87680.1 histidinol dehydrogenase [Lacibacter sp.]
MQVFTFPGREQWPQLLERPALDAAALETSVSRILQAVRTEGDAALRLFSLEFDRTELTDFTVSPAEWEAAEAAIPADLRAAIETARANIDAFHRRQVQMSEIVETMPGVRCWRRSLPIEKVGLYIPGGTAPLFSTILMLGIPAQIAGCREIVLCTPPGKDGSVHPAILYTAKVAGITRIFKVGGAQAVAAMAYGTETMPRVDKIFGPGNQYVTAAKQLVQKDGVAIDMPAGPSEVCVLADATANPAFVAADLLSQAEHGADSQVLLVSTSAELITATLQEVERQLETLPRKELARRALDNSKAIQLATPEEALELVNAYAAEHLILSCTEAEAVAGRVTTAGSVFIGHYSPESVGDYASGTNHTLPTNGYARAYSGVSLDSFVKKITFQQLSADGLARIGSAVMTLAEAEGLDAHARAVSVRLQQQTS